MELIMLFTKEYWLNCIDRIKRYIKTFIKWIICSIIIGTTCGAVGTAFHYSVEYVTKYRDSGSYIFCLLPVWSSSSYTEAADLSTTKVQIWSSVQSEIQSIMFHFEWLR